MKSAGKPDLNQTQPSGFTLVELLIVIAVIGVLAVITIVAYNGVQQRANVDSLNSDLSNAADQLKLDQSQLGAYPTTTDAANGGSGLKVSTGTTYIYSVNNATNPQTFCLSATHGATVYNITQFGPPTIGGC